MHYSTQTMAHEIAEGAISERYDVEMFFLHEDERSEIVKKIADLDDRMRKIYSDETLNAGIRLSMAGPIRKERTSLIAIKDEIAKCKGDLSLTKEEIKILLRGLAPHEQTIYDERKGHLAYCRRCQ